ncbi:hypothetical protein ACP3VV_18185, partial [Vibrio sp. PNB22_8_2]
EPYAVKVARTVLRGAALGNKCRLLDKNELANVSSVCDHQAILSSLNYQATLGLMSVVRYCSSIEDTMS